MANESCTSSTPLGTRSGKECLESVTTLIALTKGDFEFASIADAKDLSKVNEAVAAGFLAPLYQLYELTPANTEETFYESGNFKKRTSKALKITTFENYLGLCSHKALKSYQDSDFTRIIEFTEDGDVIAVFDRETGAVRGQKLKDFNVGPRMPATNDKPPYTLVTASYGDYEELENDGIIFEPNFDANADIDGVYNANITSAGVATATSVIVAVTTCAGAAVVGIAEGDILLLDVNGVEQTVTLAEVAGVYTLTGTGLVSGKVILNGIVAVDSNLYKSGGLVITI